MTIYTALNIGKRGMNMKRGMNLPSRLIILEEKIHSLKIGLQYYRSTECTNFNEFTGLITIH